jgi:hypothetical protein
MKKKKTHGGARSGSGAKSKYGEPTVNLTIRVPESKKEPVRKMVGDYLKQFIVKREENIMSDFAFDSLMKGGTVVLKFNQPTITDGDFTFTYNGEKIICEATQVSPKRISLKAKKAGQ